MSLLAALLSETVLEAALATLESGISVIPCQGKRTTVGWSRFQVVRPTPGLVHWWGYKGFLENFAIVCGKVSGNLMCMDCDGDHAVEVYEHTFPDLLTTLTIRSGSGAGKHFYYRTAAFTPTTRTKGWELRSDGCYVVAPPSVHPVSCQKYRVERYSEPMMLAPDDVEHIRTWIAAKTEAKSEKRLPSMGGVRQATPYATKALSSECDHVTRAIQGTRNRTLYLAALKMGNLIQMGYISQSEVEDRLMAAAGDLSGQDGEGASWRTIQSGIRNGMNNNRR